MTRKTTAYARKRTQQSRRINPLSHLCIIEGAKPFTEAEKTSMNLPVRLAFEALRRGQATDGDIETLAVIVNTCLVRAEQMGSPDLIAHIEDAQGALMRIKERQQRTGRIGLDGQAQADLLPIIDLHEQLLDLSTPRQMHQSLTEVLARMKNQNIVEIAR